MENLYHIGYWTFFSATLFVTVRVLLRGILYPKELLTWVWLVNGMCMYFYVYMSFQVATMHTQFLDGRSLFIGQLLPLVCILAIQKGWSSAQPSQLTRLPRAAPGTLKNYSMQTPRFAAQSHFVIGILLMVSGAMGHAYTSSIANSLGAGVSLRDTSAYIYLLFYVGFSGVAICSTYLASLREDQKMIPYMIFVAVAVAFIAPHIYNVRRGPTFTFIVALLFPRYLVRNTAPSRIWFMGILAAGGLLIIAFLQIRAFSTTKDVGWSEALSAFDAKDAVVGRGEALEDNEYLNNCQMATTMLENTYCNFGTGHLGLLVHWIPRKFWESKPDVGQGIVDFMDVIVSMEGRYGMRLIGGGASGGTFADSFLEYSILVPVFWYFFARLCSKLYYNVVVQRKKISYYVYMSILMSSHWLISQSVAAAFVPFCFFMVGFLASNMISSALGPRD